MAVAVNENDPRVKRTRELLLRAFHELATEKDMRAITVQDVTERATLNRATFYAHFQDKDALMEACFRGMIQDALNAKLSASSPFTPENLRVLFRTVRDFIDTTVRRCPRTGDSVAHPLIKSPVLEELYTFLLEWITQQSPIGNHRRYAPETLATLLSWSLFGAAVEWNKTRSKDSQEVANQVVELLVEKLEGMIAA
jgi:AcrR family transcriptional regulator